MFLGAQTKPLNGFIFGEIAQQESYFSQNIFFAFLKVVRSLEFYQNKFSKYWEFLKDNAFQGSHVFAENRDKLK